MADDRRQAKPSPEQMHLKKEEQQRTVRRRTRQIIGLALSVLIVVGAVSIVMNGVNIVRGWLDNTGQKEEFQQRLEPMVWFDVLPFDSVAQLDENMVKQLSIWGIMNSKGDTLERNEYGEPLIPAVEVDQYAASLFGPEFRFSGHGAFADTERDLRYGFDEETQMYIGPVTGFDPFYYAKVVDVKRESGGVLRVVMGYISTRTNDDKVVATLDFEHPARYMDFMMRRDGSNYYLYALQKNTTHSVASSSQPEPGSASQSELPDSLPASAAIIFGGRRFGLGFPLGLV